MSVGQDIEVGTSPTVSIAPPPDPGTVPADPNADVAANQSRYTTPEGFELTLTVAGNLTYSRTDAIELRVLVHNVSKSDLQFDPNDLTNFAMRPLGSSQAAWTDGDCRGARVPKAVETGPQTLHPNEQTEFRDTYPGPPDFANRDQCRVGPGTYSVFGLVAWCPPGATDSRGICDPAKTVQKSSAGVKVTIR